MDRRDPREAADEVGGRVGGRPSAAAAALAPDPGAWRFARSVVIEGDQAPPTCVCGRPVRNAHVLRRDADGAELHVGPTCITAVVALLREAGNADAAAELDEARRQAARALKRRKDERSAGLAERLIQDLAAAAEWLSTARDAVEHGSPGAGPTGPASGPDRRRAPQRYPAPPGWATFAARLPSPPRRRSSTALSGTRRRLARWLAEAARWSASLGIEAPPVPTDERARAMLLRIAEGGLVERGERVTMRVEPSVRDELVRRASEAPPPE